MNANLPRFECWVRRKFLYDGNDDYEGSTPCTVFAVCGIMGQAPTFHALIHETGAVFGRLPIHAFMGVYADRERELDDLCLWDSFSYHPNVIVYEPLGRCLAMLKGGDKVEGTYVCTIDWDQSDIAEAAGNGGWKCHHLIELDEGNYALLPNNRVLWAAPEHQIEPYQMVPDYKIQTRVWRAEGERRWGTGEGFAYTIEEPRIEVHPPPTSPVSSC